ncbi:MAG: class I SAM-dependent methyltransferase [Thermosphaera sp.]
MLSIKSPIKNVVLRSFAHILTYKLRKEVNRCSGIEDYVDLSYNFHLKLKLPLIRNKFRITPIQVKEEIIQLLSLLAELKPKTLLEIGTAGGGTLFLFSQIAPLNATIISIDLPGGPFGGGYPEWRTPLYKSFAKKGQKIHLIRADSHDPKTLEIVREILDDRELDFLFIDGDHTYEGVKRDFEMYSPLVRKGGIIAFHDIVEHPPETGCEVSRFWNEIKYSYSYLEIVKSWDQKWAGIGVIYV